MNTTHIKQRVMDDTVATINFARQQGYVVNKKVYQMEFPEMDYASLVPVNTNFPEWAAGQYTGLIENVGQAQWQSGYAKDIPLANVKNAEIMSQFDMFAMGYQWNVEELGKAMFMGIPLTTRRAEAARQAAEEFIWCNVLTGSSDKKWTGLINSKHVIPTASPATGSAAPKTAWALTDGTGNKKPDQIVAELNSLILGNQNIDDFGIMSALLADTILLPPRALKYISETPYGVTSPNKTILTFFMENNEYTRRTGKPIVVRDLPSLSSAAKVGIEGGGRAVGYRNAEDVLSQAIPMPFRFLEPYQDGALNFVVPGIARIGELEIIKPQALRYLDGVTIKPVIA